MDKATQTRIEAHLKQCNTVKYLVSILKENFEQDTPLDDLTKFNIRSFGMLLLKQLPVKK